MILISCLGGLAMSADASLSGTFFLMVILKSSSLEGFGVLQRGHSLRFAKQRLPHFLLGHSQSSGWMSLGRLQCIEPRKELL